MEKEKPAFENPLEQMLYEMRKDKSGKMKREKLKAIKDTIAKLKEEKFEIDAQREKAKMALQCAKTDMTPQGERNIINDIAHYKRELEKAKALVELCERKIKESEAKLPTADRQAKIDKYEKLVKDKHGELCNLSGQIKVWEDLTKLIDKMGG